MAYEVRYWTEDGEQYASWLITSDHSEAARVATELQRRRRRSRDLRSRESGVMELTGEMEQAGFAALDEYEAMKANGVFPRPSLIAHIWFRMIDASACGETNPHHSAPDGEDLSHDFEDHDCGEDTCVCADQS